MSIIYQKMSLGFHVSKTRTIGGKKKTVKMSEALTTDLKLLQDFGIAKPAAQIFVSGPQNFNETIDDEDKAKVRQFVMRTGLQLVIHGSYVDHPWNRAPGSVHNIKQELRIASKIGANGVVVHLGKGAADDDNLKYVLEEISNIPDDIRESVILWLEIHTAKPSEFTYETPEKIQALFSRIQKINTNGLRIGLCIDTAHVFASGFALDTYEKTKKWLEGLPDIPLMVHLNDSASKFASGVDRHQLLAKGELWKAYHPEKGHLPVEDSGLVAILEWAEAGDLTVILERDHDGLAHDLNLIRNLGYFIS